MSQPSSSSSSSLLTSWKPLCKIVIGQMVDMGKIVASSSIETGNTALNASISVIMRETLTQFGQTANTLCDQFFTPTVLEKPAEINMGYGEFFVHYWLELLRKRHSTSSISSNPADDEDCDSSGVTGLHPDCFNRFRKKLKRRAFVKPVLCVEKSKSSSDGTIVTEGELAWLEKGFPSSRICSHFFSIHHLYRDAAALDSKYPIFKRNYLYPVQFSADGSPMQAPQLDTSTSSSFVSVVRDDSEGAKLTYVKIEDKILMGCICEWIWSNYDLHLYFEGPGSAISTITSWSSTSSAKSSLSPETPVQRLNTKNPTFVLPADVKCSFDSEEDVYDHFLRECSYNLTKLQLIWVDYCESHQLVASRPIPIFFMLNDSYTKRFIYLAAAEKVSIVRFLNLFENVSHFEQQWKQNVSRKSASVEEIVVANVNKNLTSVVNLSNPQSIAKHYLSNVPDYKYRLAKFKPSATLAKNKIVLENKTVKIQSRIDHRWTFEHMAFAEKNSFMSFLSRFQSDLADDDPFGVRRLGVILSGKPGSGKTKTTVALCNYFQRDLVVFDFANLQSREEFQTLYDYAIKHKCIMLWDEFDHLLESIQNYSVDSHSNSPFHTEHDSDALCASPFTVVSHQTSTNSTNATTGSTIDSQHSNSQPRQISLQQRFAIGEDRDLQHLENQLSKAKNLSNKTLLEDLEKKYAECLLQTSPVKLPIDMAFLLSLLDGVDTEDGRIIVATTNYPERIEPALKRPGRFDFEMKFGYMSSETIHQLLRIIYKGETEIDEIRFHLKVQAELFHVESVTDQEYINAKLEYETRKSQAEKVQLFLKDRTFPSDRWTPAEVVKVHQIYRDLEQTVAHLTNSATSSFLR